MIAKEYMKVIGKTILKSAKGTKNFLMTVHIKEIISMVSLMELDVIHGLMGNFMKDNGLME